MKTAGGHEYGPSYDLAVHVGKLIRKK